MAFPGKAAGHHACFQMKLEERILARRLAMPFQLLMRSLASGFTLEKLRACLNCIARIASVTAKRANLAEARLPVGLDLIDTSKQLDVARRPPA